MRSYCNNKKSLSIFYLNLFLNGDFLKTYSYYLSIKKTDEISFENLIGTYKQLFCSICSTYCCNLHNIKEDNFCFDNPEIYKMDNFMHSYKSLVFTSMLSKSLSNETKVVTEKQNSNSPNSPSHTIPYFNFIQKLNEDNKNYDLNGIKENKYYFSSKDCILKTKKDYTIQDYTYVNIPISASFNSFNPIMTVDFGSIKQGKNYKIYNFDDQIMTSSTLSNDDKLKANIFHRKIYYQVKEFNNIIDLNKLQTNCNTIDIEGKFIFMKF